MKEKSIYEQICITRKKITRTEARLKQLQSEMHNLYAILFDGYEQYMELEMQELFKRVGMKRLPLQEVLKLLDEEQQ